MECVSKFKAKSYAIRYLYPMAFICFVSIKYGLWPENQKDITKRHQNQYQHPHENLNIHFYYIILML